MFFNLFDSAPQKKSDEKKKFESLSLEEKEKIVAQEKKEKNKNSFWFQTGFGITNYLVTKLKASLPEGDVRVKPLDAKYRRMSKAEMQKRVEEITMESFRNNPHVQKKMYEHAKTAAAFFRKKEEPVSTEVPAEVEVDLTQKDKEESNEGIPVFMTNKLRSELRSFGVSEEEIANIKPKDAWNLLQQKIIENKIKNKGEETPVTAEQQNDDFNVLQQTWEKAIEDMYNVSGQENAGKLMNLTAEMRDPQQVNDYIKSEGDKLQPEEKFFLQMSSQMKSFKDKEVDAQAA